MFYGILGRGGLGDRCGIDLIEWEGGIDQGRKGKEGKCLDMGFIIKMLIFGVRTHMFVLQDKRGERGRERQAVQKEGRK